DYSLPFEESEMISAVFLAGKQSRIFYSKGSRIREWTEKYIKDSMTAKKNNPGTYTTKVIRDESTKNNPEIFLQITVPVINSKNNLTDTTGYFGYLLDFNLLVEQYIKPLKLSKEDFAWIMDSQGRLIYHPRHDEMVFGFINNTSEECFSCHVSFETQKMMLGSAIPPTGEYSVLVDEPPKVMAYFPVQFQSEKWILVISAHAFKVTENLREKFKIFFILGFVILGVILIFGWLIYYVNLRRIKAEEAKRNLEQINLYQEQINQASKMASIGELVDSVAHEINTPAGIISAHVDGLMLKEDYSGTLGEVLSTIKRQTQRISDYTRSLLNYSQRMPFNPEPTNLKDLMNECLYLLGHRFRGKQINVKKKYDEGVPPVRADQRQLEQVFMNILNNAADAVDSGGEIIVSVYKSAKGSNHKGIVVEIEDNGVGISKENIDKIFNPFFSTRLNPNGTGLGLSIAKAIVSRHNGNISVKSIPGKGTSFIIFLPMNV
ncbi:MAG: ATP-binding protein, partial [Ignavibacteria bacterium]